MEDMENQRDDCQASPALGETSVKMSVLSSRQGSNIVKILVFVETNGE